MNKIFGNRLRKARIDKGLTQDELAQRLRIGRTSITNMESGKQAITIDNLVRLKNVLDIDLEKFLELPGHETLSVMLSKNVVIGIDGVPKKLTDKEQELLIEFLEQHGGRYER